jgi:hypothetical protein
VPPWTLIPPWIKAQTADADRLGKMKKPLSVGYRVDPGWHYVSGHYGTPSINGVPTVATVPAKRASASTNSDRITPRMA